ncbi:MAG: GAF domain-containing protein, partial [Gammaproteobacteria bacterium]|nr:GAF domain-containing protein [Gammaproteobacteria bacterium]
MLSGAIPDNEDERLTRLRELGIMDTLEEQAYDDLTKLASQICDAPIALVSLIDENRQWFKSHHGIDATETPRNVAFCAHAINSNDLFIIEDADHDERFHDNPLVTSEPFVKFYAGAPLILDKNIRIGTLCVIDNHAR